MATKGSKTPVTVFLAKPDVEDYKELIRQNSVFRAEGIDLGDNVQSWLISKITKPTPPKWVSFFSGYTNIKKLGLNSSTGALLIVKYKERFFILSFGIAYHQINLEKVERDFGLKTSLNCVNDQSLRCVDKSSLEAQPKESREQAGLLTDIQFFGIDVERDLLKAVTGTPRREYEMFGPRITGRDPIKFSAFINPGNLTIYFDKLLEVYRSDAYKEGAFSWVDHIGEVKDKSLIDELDADLVARISSTDYDMIWTSVPEIVDWEKTCGFKCVSINRYTRHDVTMKDLVDNLEADAIDIDTLKKRKIISVNADGEEIKRWPAYRFIYAESKVRDEIYLLNNGKWYKVDCGYSKTVDDFYNRIDRYEEEMPDYDDNTEKEYNSRVAFENGDKYILLDRKNIKISTAASPIEPCDLFRYPDQFIHVKRYGGSSVLSHLFNQGLVSGELFRREPEFREKIIEKMGEKAKATLVHSEDHKFPVVFAIVSEADEPLTIPFFSKISFKHAANRLTALGYKVYLAKISVSKQKQHLKKYPARGKLRR